MVKHVCQSQPTIELAEHQMERLDVLLPTGCDRHCNKQGAPGVNTDNPIEFEGSISTRENPGEGINLQ
jgi:hypothetical protein